METKEQIKEQIIEKIKKLYLDIIYDTSGTGRMFKQHEIYHLYAQLGKLIVEEN